MYIYTNIPTFCGEDGGVRVIVEVAMLEVTTDNRGFLSLTILVHGVSLCLL